VRRIPRPRALEPTLRVRAAQRTPRLRLGLAYLLALTAATVAVVGAHAQPLDGPWRQVLQQQRYRLAQGWSTEYCPRRPADSRSARTLDLTLQGDGTPTWELGGNRRGRAGSHRCLSANPDVRFEAYDPGARRTRCATPAGVATREEEVHELHVQGPAALELRAEYHYRWALEGHTCEAWMSELRRYERTLAEPAVAPAPPPPSPAPVAPAPEPLAAAPSPEEPERSASRAPAPDSRRRSGAEAFELRLAAGEEGPAGSAARGGAAVERRAGQAEAPLGSRRAVWLALLVLLVAAAAAGVVLLRQRAAAAAPERGSGPPPPSSPRTCPECERRLDPDQIFCPYDGTQVGPLRPPSNELEHRICPLCQRAFPADWTHCPDDDLPLLSVFGGGASLAQVPALRLGPGARICPTCGAARPRDQKYCSQDGSPLSPARAPDAAEGEEA